MPIPRFYLCQVGDPCTQLLPQLLIGISERLSTYSRVCTCESTDPLRVLFASLASLRFDARR